MRASDTIFALSTVRGVSAVAVVRISGPRAKAVAEELCGRLPDPWTLGLRSLSDPSTGEILDTGLVAWFPEGKSYTGETSAEFQLHGSKAVVDAVLTVLGKREGCRTAEPGEFTYRALRSGRLSLPEVEGLGDLLSAVTSDQRRQAQRSVEGRALAERLRSGLLECLGYLEASIDFSDEDIPDSLWPEVERSLIETIDTIAQTLTGYPAARRIREGLEVAIVGPPNIGKSTLLNRLAGREAAITSTVAGTTRDVIEVQLDVDGKLVTLLDTAGVREAQDEVEIIGVRKTLERARGADIRVFLVSSDAQTVEGVAVEPHDIVVGGKSDLTGKGVSGLTGDGVEALFDAITSRVNALTAQAAPLSHARQVTSFQAAMESLSTAKALLPDGEAELVSHHVRAAIGALDGFVGRLDVEDVLGAIFSKFCIGK